MILYLLKIRHIRSGDIDGGILPVLLERNEWVKYLFLLFSKMRTVMKMKERGVEQKVIKLRCLRG